MPSLGQKEDGNQQEIYEPGNYAGLGLVRQKDQQRPSQQLDLSSHTYQILSGGQKKQVNLTELGHYTEKLLFVNGWVWYIHGAPWAIPKLLNNLGLFCRKFHC